MIKRYLYVLYKVVFLSRVSREAARANINRSTGQLPHEVLNKEQVIEEYASSIFSKCEIIVMTDIELDLTR